MGGVIWLIFGSVGLAGVGPVGTSGTGYPPAAINDLRSDGQAIGALFVAGAIFQLGLGLIAVRRGERWASLVLLAVPFVGLVSIPLDMRTGQSFDGAFYIFLILAVPTLVGLLLNIPKARPARPLPGSPSS